MYIPFLSLTLGIRGGTINGQVRSMTAYSTGWLLEWFSLFWKFCSHIWIRVELVRDGPAFASAGSLGMSFRLTNPTSRFGTFLSIHPCI